MVQSMTGFAAVSGEGEGASWSIEIRGVNAKGLDVRMRLPEKLGPHEAAFKTIFTKKFERGNINISVRVDTSKDDNAISLDEDVIDAYLNAAVKIRSKAKNMGLKLSPSTAAEFLLFGAVCATEMIAKSSCRIKRYLIVWHKPLMPSRLCAKRKVPFWLK
jgi:uncharacterized protein (TIGR00255 family)